MDYKNDVYDLEFVNIMPPNVTKLFLDKEPVTDCKVHLCKSVIEMAGETFAKDIRNYIENGGDTNNLTIKNVYGKKNK